MCVTFLNLGKPEENLCRGSFDEETKQGSHYTVRSNIAEETLKSRELGITLGPSYKLFLLDLFGLETLGCKGTFLLRILLLLSLSR